MNVVTRDFFENENNIYEELIKLTKNGPILIKDLNRGERYNIYKSMYCPLTFEKIFDENDHEKVTIKVYRKSNYNKYKSEDEIEDEIKIKIDKIILNLNIYIGLSTMMWTLLFIVDPVRSVTYCN